MKKAVILSLCLTVAGLAAVKFPYPQAHGYGNGTVISTVWNCAGETASSMLKKHFLTFLRDYYEENGSSARIKFDENQYTVSEGIGYGMIMMVYFSDNTTSYQSQFDKLWNYYQDHANGNGLMNWKIQGFGGAVGQNGATDADEDVAFALAMAYYQFGDSKYKTAAESLISKIRQKEFNSDGMHKLGDAWDNYKNPSYVSPAAYEIFKKFDSGNSGFWDKAISANYSFLQKNQNSSTGIPSGWADNNGNPIQGNNGYNFTGFDYDATRAPWRWAWSYAWYGHTQAGTLMSKLATWVKGRLATQLYINMNVNGTINSNGQPCTTNGCKANGSSIGSLSSVLIYNSSYQDKLNENYSSLMGQQDGYYHSSLRLLTGLLMSGNMQDLSTATPVTPETFVVPDSCNAEVIYHENSGAYGWNSTSVVLTEESETGVKMGDFIHGPEKVVTKVLGELKAGETYTLTMDLFEEYTSDARIKVNLYKSEEDRSTDYCGGSYKMSNNATVTYTCTFTSTGETNPLLSMSMPTWNALHVTVSNLSLKSSSGEEIAPPSSSSEMFVPDFGQTVFGKLDASYHIDGRVLSLDASSRASITVALFDMQGRLLRKIQMEPGTSVNLGNLRSGSYVLSLKNGNQFHREKVTLK